MSNERSSKGSAPRNGKPQRKARKALLRDPVVRTMVYAAIVLVVLFLATVVGALFTGVISTSATVDTSAEREILISRSEALGPQATAESWASYVDALTASGDLRQAQITLEHAKGTMEATETAPALDLAEARLLRAQERYEAAVEAALAAMEQYQSEYQAKIDEGGETASTAKQYGIDYRYFEAALVAAYAYGDMSQWEDAVKMFDIYLKNETTASDIFVDRGNAKLALKDYAGAEADYNEALRFVPYDEEAKAGLEKIGAVK